MKIAYLILAHDHPVHLTRLIAALQSEHAFIFLHIDKKSRGVICPPVANNITLIRNSVAVYWGGFSIVQATLNLLQEAAASGEYDYFILLSGADYPHPEYVKFYKHTRVPDAMFFHTIIGNSPFKENVVNAVMYADWVTGPSTSHPATITLRHLPLFAQETSPAAYGNGKRDHYLRENLLTVVKRLFGKLIGSFGTRTSSESGTGEILSRSA